MGSIKLAAGLVVAAGMFGATPSLADYMSECEELIATWESCMESSTDCRAEEQRIIEECRCHEKRQGEWIFVRGTMSSGVCNAPDPTIITPPPPEPPQPPYIIEHPDPRNGGGDEEERRNGGEEDGDDGESRSDSGGVSSSTVAREQAVPRSRE